MNRLAEKCMRSTADLRKNIRFRLEYASTLFCGKANIIILARIAPSSLCVFFACLLFFARLFSCLLLVFLGLY